MRDKDHEKLMRAGFSILRADRNNLVIKIKSGSHSWKTLAKTPTAAELDKRMAELLQHPKNIED